MKKLVLLLMLLAQQAQTQTGISGEWRAASVVPDGSPDASIREFNSELKAAGSSVTDHPESKRARISRVRIGRGSAA
jgi:hypothetical protein